MQYSKIENACKKSRGGRITFSNLVSGRFYHVTKGHTNLKITGGLKLDELTELIGGRGHNYKRLISDYLSWGRDCGILERLVYNGKRWEYVAGQDYVSEMNTIRKIFREG